MSNSQDLLGKLKRRLSTGVAGKMVFYLGPECGTARHGSLSVDRQGGCVLDFGGLDWVAAASILVGPHLLRVVEFDDPALNHADRANSTIAGTHLVQLLEAASAATGETEVTATRENTSERRSKSAATTPAAIRQDWRRELLEVLADCYGAAAEARLAEWQQRHPDAQPLALLDLAESWLAQMIGSEAARRRLAALREKTR